MIRILILVVIISSSCTSKQQVKHLPQAVTNNAVAIITQGKNFEIYSFNGLASGKTSADINNRAFQFKNNKWQKLVMPKESQAVLASTAVNIGNKIYVIGGYTVATDDSEKSVADIFEFNTALDKWRLTTKMPVPVDDTVALVYAKRYIYLISGWHDTDNVDLVQVYDTKENHWFNATPYPAPAVFGHAGGIVGNTVIICDGVKVIQNKGQKSFVSSPQCLKGEIDSTNPSQIKWNDIPHHSGTAYYRMAATGSDNNNQIVFAGGSDNPYNYDGIGYDGVPSTASSKVFAFDLKNNLWKSYQDIPANMDHRALLRNGEDFYIVGGMQSNQEVSDEIIKFKLVD